MLALLLFARTAITRRARNRFGPGSPHSCANSQSTRPWLAGERDDLVWVASQLRDFPIDSCGLAGTEMTWSGSRRVCANCESTRARACGECLMLEPKRAYEAWYKQLV